ncbi:glycosyltransferase [Alkalilacustris brevis]|uniref:glycosyltransferase n=1 Tax=Alkalilacustris brevis TaxID=2026338 RepID=UPI00139044BD|nr:glycosyltransferase [Alkalilacustris brevis]
MERRKTAIEAALPPWAVERVAQQVAGADVVVVDGILLADIARHLSEAGHAVIVDMHNVESALLREIDLARRTRLAALWRAGTWRRAAEAERDIARKVCGLWVCSQADRQRLQAIAGPDIFTSVIPNPVPPWCSTVQASSPAARRGADRDAMRLLFVGHLGYRPNIHAARRLMRHILPALRQDLPDARLDLCGRAPRKSLIRLAARTPGARLTGDPKDLAPFYAEATMTLIPLTEGGGTRLKVLEALQLGLPVIASAKAVEGLDLTHGEHFLRAESDSDFIRAAARLAANPALRESLSRAGRRHIAEGHSHDVLCAAIAHSIEACHDRRPGTAA